MPEAIDHITHYTYSDFKRSAIPEPVPVPERAPVHHHLLQRRLRLLQVFLLLEIKLPEVVLPGQVQPGSSRPALHSLPFPSAFEYREAM